MRFDHLRADWEDPANPVQSNSLFHWENISHFAIHFPAVSFAPSGGDEYAERLRDEQAFYTGVRGYSLGYNSTGSKDGDSWEVRGDTYRCAANAGNDLGDWNDIVWAHQIAVSGSEPATQAQIECANDLLTQVQERAQRELFTRVTVGGGQWRDNLVVPDTFYLCEHKQIATTGTSCPGTGIDAQFHDGKFHPVVMPEPKPEPEPEPEEEDVAQYIATYKDELWQGDRSLRRKITWDDVDTAIGKSAVAPTLNRAGEPITNRDDVKAVDLQGLRWLGRHRLLS